MEIHHHYHFNIFRILGDLSHTASKCILIWAIHSNRSAEGRMLMIRSMGLSDICIRGVTHYAGTICYCILLSIHGPFLDKPFLDTMELCAEDLLHQLVLLHTIPHDACLCQNTRTRKSMENGSLYSWRMSSISTTSVVSFQEVAS